MIAHHITQLVQTSTASPSQWEGRTSAGYEAYVRYRYHELYVQVGPSAEPVFVLRMRHVRTAEPDGNVMTLDELKALTSGIIAWP